MIPDALTIREVQIWLMEVLAGTAIVLYDWLGYELSRKKRKREIEHEQTYVSHTSEPSEQTYALHTSEHSKP
jgi:hypothetical protein